MLCHLIKIYYTPNTLSTLSTPNKNQHLRSRGPKAIKLPMFKKALKSFSFMNSSKTYSGYSGYRLLSSNSKTLA